MKKLITILAGIVVFSGSIANVVACENKNHQKQTSYIKQHQTKLNPSNPKASTIKPGTATIAKKEAQKVNNKVVTLNNNALNQYNNHSAFEDTKVIDQFLVNNKILKKTEIKDFQFDKNSKLKIGTNKNIKFAVKHNDGSHAQGAFHITINPYASPLNPSTPSANLIANKLANKTVKLDPTFWGNKNIISYKKQLQTTLVAQKLLTATEAQYVQGASFVINKIKVYEHVTFKIVQNNVTAYAKNITLNANETNTDILNKLAHANITFNYDFWKNKKMRDYNNEVRSILINEHILNQLETNYLEMESSQVINQGAKTYQIQFSVDYYPPEISRMINVHVVDDGLSAASIAHKLATGGEYNGGGKWTENNTYFLKPTSCNQDADSNTVMQNLRNVLKYDCQWNSYLNSFTLPHTLITNAPNGNNVTASVYRDGQTAQATINLVAYKRPFINLEDQDDYDMSFDVQLTPIVTKYLAGYFVSHSSIASCLEYFYQIIDNGEFNTYYTGLPKVDTSFFLSWDILENWMDDYGYAFDNKSHVAEFQSSASSQSNVTFGKALKHQILYGQSNYLSMMISWHCDVDFDVATYSTYTYAFW